MCGPSVLREPNIQLFFHTRSVPARPSSRLLLHIQKRGRGYSSSIPLLNLIKYLHTSKMVGKKSGRALLREEGLQRTDNNMEFTTWPQVNMINQKNYYTYGASIFISLCFVESP